MQDYHGKRNFLITIKQKLETARQIREENREPAWKTVKRVSNAELSKKGPFDLTSLGSKSYGKTSILSRVRLEDRK